MAKTIDINDAKQRLSELLNLAKEGNEIVISECNVPIARLTPISPPLPPRKPRVAGLHAGAIWTSEDFDQPLPDEFWIGGL